MKYQRRWTQALVGEFIHGQWKMAASQTTSLVPTCSLRGLLKRFILNCSIFKVTAWFHIHNHSCMNVQFHFRPRTNHLLSPRILPRSRRIDWSVSYLPRAALFQIWKQTLADWTLPFSLIFCLFLYFTSYSLLLLLSHPGIIRQCSEGIIAAPSLLVEVTAVLSITMGTWVIALEIEGREYEWTDLS